MKYPKILRTSILTATATFALLSCKTQFKTTQTPFAAQTFSNSLERGKNLCFNTCAPCHYNTNKGLFIGEQMNDLPKFMGKVFASNLTASTVYGIGSYTDAELKYLIKTGISKSGRYIPYMLRPTMADKDINDIIVYLRSGDTSVAAVDTTVGRTRYSIIGKAAVSFSGKPQPDTHGIEAPNENDEIAYGRYLVDITGCYHCHSKNIAKLNYTDPEKTKGYMAGGMKWRIDGQKIYASNLTPHNTSGIGRYTKNDFRKALRDMETPEGTVIKYPMPRYKHLTDKQADAIFAYIKTLAPVVKH